MEPQQTSNANSNVPPKAGVPNPSVSRPATSNASVSNGDVPERGEPVPSTPGMPTSSTPSGAGPGSSFTPTPPSKKSARGFLIGFIILLVGIAIAAAIVASNRSSDKKGDSANNSNSSSSQSQNSSSDKLYTGKNGEFTVLKPEGWKEDAASDPAALIEGAEGVTYIPANSSSANEDLSVIAFYSFPLREGMTLDSIFEQGKEIYKSFPEYQEVSYKKFKRDGKDAAYFEVKYKLGELVRQAQTVVISNGKAYTVTTTLPDAEWEANKATIEAVHESLKAK